MFVSKIARMKYKNGHEDLTTENQQTMGDIFNGIQFHFHNGAEHTIDGKRHDLEMHTVHLIDPKLAGQSEFTYAAVGIMFSVDDYTAKLTSD